MLLAERILRFDFWVSRRGRVEERRGRRPVSCSSSDQCDLIIFSPIRGVAETAKGVTGAVCLERP